MKKNRLSLVVLMSVTFLTSCGGEAETQAAEVDNEAVEETVSRPAPETIVSGNTITVEDRSAGLSGEKGYDCIYTVVDYTTNVDFSEMPIKEYSEPGDDQQILHITMQAEMTSLMGYNKKAPADGFDLILEEGGEDMFQFTGFTDEFSEDIKVLDKMELNQIGELEFYFRVPIDADLSNAYLDLYLGSDTDAMQLLLNP